MCYYVQKPEIILVGQICADLRPNCSLCVKSTKFSGNIEKNMGINKRYGAIAIFPVNLCFGSLSYMATILTGSNEAPKWKYMEKQIFRQK